jgi:hypothetical protein
MQTMDAYGIFERIHKNDFEELQIIPETYKNNLKLIYIS